MICKRPFSFSQSLAASGLNLLVVISDPPSTIRCPPVIWAEAGEHKKRATPAMSVGAPTRPREVEEMLSDLPFLIYGLRQEIIPVGWWAAILSPATLNPNAVMFEGKTLTENS